MKGKRHSQFSKFYYLLTYVIHNIKLNIKKLREYIIYRQQHLILIPHKISKYKPLLTRIDEANIEKIRKQTKES